MDMLSRHVLSVLRNRYPVAFTWVVVALVMTFVGWQYFSHPKPGPYGVCYSNKGRNPCAVDTTKAGKEKDLALIKR